MTGCYERVPVFPYQQHVFPRDTDDELLAHSGAKSEARVSTQTCVEVLSYNGEVGIRRLLAHSPLCINSAAR